jgi:hypothetical protein
MQGVFEYRFIQFAFEDVINQHLAIIITDMKIFKSLCRSYVLSWPSRRESAYYIGKGTDWHKNMLKGR